MNRNVKIGIGVGAGLLLLALTYSASAHMAGYGGFGFPMMGYGMMDNGFMPGFDTPKETEGPSLPSLMTGYAYQGHQNNGYGNGYEYSYGGYGCDSMMGW